MPLTVIFWFIINASYFIAHPDVSDTMESCCLGICQQIQMHPEKGMLKTVYGT